ncbi:MAG: hypothetical protein JSU70_13510 [Phycisphaerales bacterium]|nr:MAG: hypothetical protein JSU70_13510 [Phycisphaerales bacterium]
MFYGLAIAGLYVLGVWWCYEVVRRFRRDVQEIREQREVVRTGAIVFVWALTVVIAVVLIRYTLVVIEEVSAWIP